MARLPDLPNGSRVQQVTQINFGGLHAGENCRDGEWKNMKNMSVRDLPVIRTRERRQRAPWTAPEAAAVYCPDEERMIMIDGNGSVWQIMLATGEKMFLASAYPSGIRHPWESRIVRFGERAMVMPDGVLLMINYKIKGSVASTADVENPQEGDAWLAGVFAEIYVYTLGKWVNKGPLAVPVQRVIETSEVTFGGGTIHGEAAEANTLTIERYNLKNWFRVGDAVTISGCTEVTANNLTPIIREIDGYKLIFDENTFTMPEGQDSYTETGTIRVERKWPELDFVFEHANRMWGGKGKTIYCSKLGDPLNWYVLGDGLSTDGWQLETQSDGELTGGISYSGYPTFFKPKKRIMIYGSDPSNFSTREIDMPGAVPGNGMTQIAGGRMIYRAEDTMMIYASEGYPTAQRDELGRVLTDESDIAASTGREYIGLIDANWRLGIYSWSADRGAWAMEDQWGDDDDHDVRCMMQTGTRVLLMRIDGTVELIRGNPINGWLDEEDFDSLLETGDMTGNAANHKWVTRVLVRLKVEAGAKVEIDVSCDGGEWIRTGIIDNGGGRKTESWYFPVRPNRCDNFRIRFRGKGEWQLRSMATERRIGSAMH